MTAQTMEVQMALERGAQLPFALVRLLSAAVLGPAPSAVDETDLLEVRFFSAKEEIRVFRRNGALQAVLCRENGGERFADRTYQIANPEFGTQITVRTYLDFDEDGQGFWSGSRLVDWRGEVRHG